MRHVIMTAFKIPKMKGDVSLFKLISNVSIFLGVMNFLTSAILCNGEMVIEEHVYDIHRITPIEYQVNLTLNQKKQREECAIYFDGECEIEIIVNIPTNNITLDAQRSNINIHSASILSIQENDPKESDYPVEDITQNMEMYFLTIYFTRNLFGRYLLKLRFDTCLSDADAFHVSYANKTKMLLVIQLLPTRTRALFPCFDDLRLKAHFRIKLIIENYYTTSSGKSVLYKGNVITLPVVRVLRKTTYEIATVVYETSFFTYKNPIWYRKAMENHVEFIQTIAVNIMEYLINNWNISFPFPPANILVIPGFLHDAVTKQGINIYSEGAILYKEGTDPFFTKVAVTRLIARVSAHEILRCLVSPISWNHLWINEAIAMLLGQHIVNKVLLLYITLLMRLRDKNVSKYIKDFKKFAKILIANSFPELRLFDLFIVQFHQESLRLDVENVIGPIIQVIRKGTTINSIFSFSYYLKAPVILNVLRRLLSDEVFWKGVQNYLTNTEATFDIFCDAMESAVEEANVRADVQLPKVLKVMREWTRHRNYQVLKVIRETNPPCIKIKTKNYMGLHVHYLPLTIATQSNLNFALNANTVHVWEQTEKDYKFQYYEGSVNDWIILNSQQLGYYHIMYEEENWRKIANYLNSENYTKIPVLNRAQIINDAFYFLMTGQMDLSMFLNLTNYLSREKDYVAWYPMFKGLEYISGYLPYADNTFIKQKIVIPVTTFLIRSRFNTTVYNHIDDCLQQEISKWSCIFESLYCRVTSNVILNSKIHSSVPTLWKDWVYCKGLMDADSRTWNQIFDIFLNENNNEMLRYLACSKSSDIIINYMDQIANNTKIKNIIANKGIKTFINIFHSIVERHTKSISVLEYILDNFYYVIPREICTIVALIDIINHIYLRQHLVKVFDFIIIYNLPSAELLTKKLITRMTQIHDQKYMFLQSGVNG